MLTGAVWLLHGLHAGAAYVGRCWMCSKGILLLIPWVAQRGPNQIANLIREMIEHFVLGLVLVHAQIEGERCRGVQQYACRDLRIEAPEHSCIDAGLEQSRGSIHHDAERLLKALLHAFVIEERLLLHDLEQLRIFFQAAYDIAEHQASSFCGIGIQVLNALQQRDHLIEVVLKNGKKDVFLAREVEVDGSFPNAGFFGDFTDGCGVVPLGCEHVRGGAPDGLNLP